MAQCQMCASANSSYETMKTSEALDDVGPRNTIAKDMNERWTPDENKRSPSKEKWSTERLRRDGAQRLPYEESIYLAHSSNVTLNLFIVFNSFICRMISSILPSP